VLRNFEGVITTYTEPLDYRNECHCLACEAERKKKVAADKAVDGVISLLEGERMNIEPARLKRHERNEARK
jgi:lysine 2,3-aminomutase